MTLELEFYCDLTRKYKDQGAELHEIDEEGHKHAFSRCRVYKFVV